MAYPDPAEYLPTVALYLDDIYWESQNPWCSKLLAVSEFNGAQTLRKLTPDRFLRSRRVFKNARWIDQIFLLHVLDHAQRNHTQPTRPINLYAALR